MVAMPSQDDRSGASHGFRGCNRGCNRGRQDASPTKNALHSVRSSRPWTRVAALALVLLGGSALGPQRAVGAIAHRAAPAELAVLAVASGAKTEVLSEVISLTPTGAASPLESELDRLAKTVSWLAIALGLLPGTVAVGLWAGRRRLVAHLVAGVRQQLGRLGLLEERVNAAEAQAQQAIDHLHTTLHTTRQSARQTTAQLQELLEEVRCEADSALDRLRVDLGHTHREVAAAAVEVRAQLLAEREGLRQQVGTLEHEFISNMQILAGQAERQKADLLTKFCQTVPSELIELARPQIEQHLRVAIEEMADRLVPPAGLAEASTPAECAALGEREFVARRPEAALGWYERAIDRDPDCYAAWLGKGVVLEALGRHEAAIVAYDRVVRLKPDGAEGWHNRGLVLARLGKYEEAVASYGQALALRPDAAHLWGQRGILLAKLERYEAAVQAYDRALALEPDSAESVYNRANVLARLERYRESLSDYDRAITLGADLAVVWHNRGIVLGKLGDPASALESYEQALERDRQDAEIWYSRGNALLRLDCPTEAVASYQEAIALNPRHQRARRNLDLAQRQGDPLREPAVASPVAR